MKLSEEDKKKQLPLFERISDFKNDNKKMMMNRKNKTKQNKKNQNKNIIIYYFLLIRNHQFILNYQSNRQSNFFSLQMNCNSINLQNTMVDLFKFVPIHASIPVISNHYLCMHYTSATTIQ